MSEARSPGHLPHLKLVRAACLEAVLMLGLGDSPRGGPVDASD